MRGKISSSINSAAAGCARAAASRAKYGAMYPDATFTADSRFGEIAVRFVADQTYVVRNKAGEIVEGSPREVKKTRDIWTFARQMGSDDPNWQLVATGD